MEKQGISNPKRLSLLQKKKEFVKQLSAANVSYESRAKKIAAAATLTTLEGLENSTGTAGSSSGGDYPLIATRGKKLFFDEKGPYVLTIKTLAYFTTEE